MHSSELLSTEYPEYFSLYIGKVSPVNLLEGLESNMYNSIDFWKSIPKNKLEYSYSDGKWTIKDIIQHVIDTERIFTNRALRFARNDETILPGFNEDFFANNSNGNSRSLEDLIEEYKSVRISMINLFKSFTFEMMNRSGNGMSVRSIAFIMIGHVTHHNEVIREKYLK